MTTDQQYNDAPAWVYDIIRRLDGITQVHDEDEKGYRERVLGSLNDLSGTLGAVAGSVGKLTQASVRLEADVKLIRNALQETRVEVARHNERLVNLEGEMHSLRDEMHRLTERTQEIGTELQRMDGELQSLTHGAQDPAPAPSA